MFRVFKFLARAALAIISVCLLDKPSFAASNSLIALRENVLGAMRDPDFKPSLFCTTYWLPSSRDLCLRALPWGFLKTSEAALIREIPLKEGTAFLTIQLRVGENIVKMSLGKTIHQINTFQTSRPPLQIIAFENYPNFILKLNTPSKIFEKSKSIPA